MRKDKENEPLGSPIFDIKMSECRNAGAERERESGGERKTVRRAFKALGSDGRKGGVIPGSFRFEFERERKQW